MEPIPVEERRFTQYCIPGTDQAIVGISSAMRDMFSRIDRLAQVAAPVLILGETGTGKELVARALHRDRRRDPPGRFIAVNTAAIPHDVFESELFGHEKGAFTGAMKNYEGKVLGADGGTLFLDEIGRMPLNQQSKILRLIQEGEVSPLGSLKTYRPDVRFLAASNRDLRQLVESGEFHEDLLYRLSTFELRLPPLRERREDIIPIAEYLLEKHGPAYGHAHAELSAQAARELTRTDIRWRGNVRELEQQVHRALFDSPDGVIRKRHLSLECERRPALVAVPAPQAVERPKAEKPWYDPVLAVSVAQLVQCKGALDRDALKAVALSKTVSSIALSDECAARVFFPTPETLALLFNDPSTDDYKRLEDRFASYPFTPCAEEPFRIFTSLQLAKHGGYGNTTSLLTIAKAYSPYDIPLRRGGARAIVLPERLVELYVPDGVRDRPERIERLRSLVRSFYFDEFLPWKPVALRRNS